MISASAMNTVFGNRITTPAADHRLLPGVTRTRVLELVVALGKDAQEFFAPVAVLSLLLEPVL